MRLLVVGIGIVVLLRLAMAFLLGISDDEAYYWDWAQHLSLSYYEHPPMTAWLISLSESIFGKSEFSVRLPAILLSIGTFWVLLDAVKERLNKNETLIFLALFVLIPIYSIGGQLIVPDLPLLFFWALAFWSLCKLLRSPTSYKYFFILVLSMGFALLSKLTAVFLCLSVLILLAVQPALQRWLNPKRFLPALILLLIIVCPVIIWNWQNDWPMFNFHLNVRHQSQFSVARWLQFIASQLIYYTPFVFPFLIKFFWDQSHAFDIRKFKFKNFSYEQLAFIFGFPVLLLFFIQPFYSDFKPHWTTPGFLLVLPFLAKQIYTTIQKSRRWDLFFKAGLVGLFLINVFFYSSFFYPILPKVYRFTNNAEWNPRFDISNDFYGWSDLVHHLEKNDDYSSSFLISHRYQLTAPFAFYSGKRVYSIGKNSNQYKLFQTEEVMAEIKNKNSYFIADNRYLKQPSESINFETCKQLEPFKVFRANELARTFYIWHCQNFIGPK